MRGLGLAPRSEEHRRLRGNGVQWWTLAVDSADAVDSLTLASAALAALEDVAQMRAAVVATHLLARTNQDMRAAFGEVALAVGVPPAVLELGVGRVQRSVACLADEVAALGEELAVLAAAWRPVPAPGASVWVADSAEEEQAGLLVEG